jgi:excisionase family DNA binding protein
MLGSEAPSGRQAQDTQDRSYSRFLIFACLLHSFIFACFCCEQLLSLHVQGQKATEIMMSAVLPEYLTKQEVAARCRVSVKTIERWMQAGLLQGVRATERGRVLIPRDSLLQSEHRIRMAAAARRRA